MTGSSNIYPPCAASRRERQRLGDERTLAMTTRDYSDFTRLRERAKLGGIHFKRWYGALLRRSKVPQPPSEQECRFLGRLATTRIVKLVESANRAAHAGRLAPPTGPLSRHSYHAAVASADGAK